MTVRGPADVLDLDAHAITVRASTIAPRPLAAIWPGVLWLGKTTLVAGDPGLGKSMLTCSIAAKVSTGEPWPCASERREPADVVMLSAEDDPEDTLVPRLIAAGADLERITFVRGVREMTDDGPRERWLTLDRHLDQLAGALAVKPETRLVIIDPLSAYLGSTIDSHNEGDVRAVLAGLADVAAHYRVA
ncbi:MAG: AAA family ATPase, partial [Gammaproteobacteria bacterium]